MSDHDPWRMLHADDYDPLFAETLRNFCNAPSDGFICTRQKGHPGLHVASYSAGIVCCDAWTNIPREMQLPEGF